MNSIQCRILVFLVLLTSCFSPVYGKDKKPRQAIEKLSIDGPYLLKADDGSMRAISVDGKGGYWISIIKVYLPPFHSRCFLITGRDCFR